MCVAEKIAGVQMTIRSQQMFRTPAKLLLHNKRVTKNMLVCLFSFFQFLFWCVHDPYFVPKDIIRCSHFTTLYLLQVTCYCTMFNGLF